MRNERIRPSVKKYKRLELWQQAVALAIEVYDTTGLITDGNKHRLSAVWKRAVILAIEAYRRPRRSPHSS